ncbi:glycosyltransferase family 4 protein [Desulfosediminicola flagellatus]|uniref:glycosyltransferase family 4 protein n=1 Tax=Desulfosediminicola flagellatus TaxID=2569541 RepID=UPI0010AC3827|nr:glycosyltransferase family 4 protein [Desulfosediminicola flagellatus]
MKILFHCWEYPPRGSGIGSYIFHMTQAFQSLDCYTVVVTSHGDEGKSREEFNNGVIYRYYKIEDIGKPFVSELVRTLAEKHQVDWIEGADHLGESAGLFGLNLRGIPVIIKAHYNDVLKRSRYGHVYYSWQKYLIGLACIRNRRCLRRESDSLKKAAVLISPCERFLTEMEEQGVSLPDKRWVIPNPISPIEKVTHREATDPTLLLVGRIDIGKGIAHLSKMIEKLKKKFPNLKIEIAGEDSYARFLGSTRKWLIGKLGVNVAHIKFLGHLDRKNLERAYSRAWVVIVPSGWDTFPTVVLESMVRGVPVVASPNGGMAEMLEGTLNPIADPVTMQFASELEILLSNKSLRKQVGLSGRDKALSAYDPLVIARNYIDKVDSLKASM